MLKVDIGKVRAHIVAHEAVEGSLLAETVKGYEASALFGMGAPKKTPPPAA